MAQGFAGVAIATRTDYTVVQISRLRRRFAEQGLAGLADRPALGPAAHASPPANGRRWWR